MRERVKNKRRGKERQIDKGLFTGVHSDIGIGFYEFEYKIQYIRSILTAGVELGEENIYDE